MSVKQERHDEAEILELAAKMREENKAKMVNTNRNPTTQPGSSMGILNYLSTNNNSKPKFLTVNANTLSSPSKIIDEASLRGRFGWIMIGKVHIPYIIRGTEYFCSVRMVEMKVLNKYLSYLNPDIYNCTCIRSYYITEAESRLLNEINMKHCDCQYGRDQFTTRDLIVRMIDADEFYKFLSSCYAKLLSGEVNSLDRCGFIRINKESVVPYTMYKDSKYVPLFYFEGETDNLKQKAEKLEGWDLAYLKFCCKVQGIRNELFAHDSCSMISLNDIKNYFPPNTVFEDYWPKKNMDSQLLITNTSRAPQQIVQWTRQPTAPPVPPSAAPKPATQAKVTNNAYPVYGVPGNVVRNFHPTNTGNRTGNTLVRGSSFAANTSAPNRHVRPNYYNSVSQVPPALVRASQPQSPAYSRAPTSDAPNYMIVNDRNLQQTSGYHQPPTSQMPKYPPPLLDVRHLNGNMGPRGIPNSYAGTSISNQLNNQTSYDMLPRPTQPPVQQRPMANNGCLILNNKRNMQQLQDSTQPGMAQMPYVMQQTVIDSKMISCINMKPYSLNELLVTLPDICSNFFNNVPIQSCQQALQVLGVELFKPNMQQMQLLAKSGKCQNANDLIPLVQVRHVMDYMPQMKYILGGMLQSDMGSKRTRTS